MNITPELVDKFEGSLRLHGRSSQTAAKYGRTISSFAAWRTGRPTGPVSTDLAQWLADDRDRLGAGTIRQRLATARSFCEFAQADSGPLAKYKVPPLPAPRPHPLPGGVPDGRRMIAASTTAPQRHAVALGLLAGLRVQEIVSVTRDAIRTRHHGGERYTVLVVRGKGGKEREIPVSSELAGLLAEMPATGPLVPLSNVGARRTITRAAALAGVTGSEGDPVSSHDLRATFATAVYHETRDILLVQRLLGHASVTTTQVYIESLVGEFRSAVEF